MTSEFRCPWCNSKLSPDEADNGYCNKCDHKFSTSSNDYGVVYKARNNC